MRIGVGSGFCCLVMGIHCATAPLKRSRSICRSSRTACQIGDVDEIAARLRGHRAGRGRPLRRPDLDVRRRDVHGCSTSICRLRHRQRSDRDRDDDRHERVRIHAAFHADLHAAGGGDARRHADQRLVPRHGHATVARRRRSTICDGDPSSARSTRHCSTGTIGRTSYPHPTSFSSRAVRDRRRFRSRRSGRRSRACRGRRLRAASVSGSTSPHGARPGVVHEQPRRE